MIDFAYRIVSGLALIFVIFLAGFIFGYKSGFKDCQDGKTSQL